MPSSVHVLGRYQSDHTLNIGGSAPTLVSLVVSG